jgi:hypothetical protein
LEQLLTFTGEAVIVIVGFYHTISFLCNGLQVELEDWSARFPAE